MPAKLTPGLTVRLIVVVCVRLPLVPVTVTVAVPVVAVLLAVRVSVLVVVVLAGLNDAVTPLGNPEADRLTLLLKPLTGVTVMVLVPFAPCRIVRLPGEADSEKSGEFCCSQWTTFLIWTHASALVGMPLSYTPVLKYQFPLGQTKPVPLCTSDP